MKEGWYDIEGIGGAISKEMDYGYDDRPWPIYKNSEGWGY